MSKFLPRPQPIAVTRSDSSLFSSTFASDTLSVFSTLPRSGRIACRARSSAQREDRLPRAIAPLLRRPSRRIALDDEQLAAVAGRIRAVAQLAGQVQAA